MSPVLDVCIGATRPPRVHRDCLAAVGTLHTRVCMCTYTHVHEHTEFKTSWFSRFKGTFGKSVVIALSVYTSVQGEFINFGR